ncbi:MAG: SCP2 sterol-binding domain-containing protein [Myxococcales bacterium]
MALQFPSAPWANAYKDAINQNALYKKSAANWDQGAIALVCQAAPEFGVPTAVGIVLDLIHGECRGVVYTEERSVIDATPFVIEASYAQWKAVMRGETDPIRAMLQGQLKLSKGHLPTIIKDVEGSKQLVLSASKIDTEFLG